MSAVKFLLENGADVNTKDKKNFTLLMYCTQFNDLSLISLVLSYGAKVNVKDTSGLSALDYAINNHNLDAIKLLVDGGSDIFDESYMLAMDKDYKDIILYFDSFDPNKQIFQGKNSY